MDDIGRTLKNKRQELNKSIEEIYDKTRVSIKHIKFLEENNFTFLPETYVKSFLQTYATTLGLNSQEILDAYNDYKAAQIQDDEEQESVTQSSSESVDMEMLPAKSTVAPAALIARKQFPFTEGVLGVSASALLVLLIFAYVQYRSQIFEKTNTGQPHFRIVERYSNLADISVLQLKPPDSLATAPPLELQITALTDITLQLNIDNKTDFTHRLSRQQRQVWIARNRFEITLSQVVNFDGVADSLQQTKVDSGSVVKLSFARE